jgi:hypothetical protein
MKSSSNVTPSGTSDNSSDNSSSNIHKKSGGGGVDAVSGNNTKSEIEIVDQKIIKCINEINFLKQKIQSKILF